MSLEILIEDGQRVASSMELSILANKDVIITGANGLIGINFLFTFVQIAERLPGVNIISIFHSKPPETLRLYLRKKKIKYMYGDLTDEKFLKKIPNSDIIIHAAGSGEPTKFIKDPLMSLKINTLTTLSLFSKLNSSGRFLFISSSDIYNGLKSVELTETQIGTTNTDHPRACYIEGKRAGETICNIYRQMGFNAYSVRLALTYGPGMKVGDQRVLPSFIQKGLKGRIDLLDSGNAYRTFCYVSDAIEMMLFVITGGKQNLYNVGGIYSCKISELASLIGRICNVPVIIPKKDDGIKGAPENVFIDISKLQSEYEKEKFIDLDEGLKRTINWFKLI